MSVEKRVSTDGLTRCTRCRRHVQAGDTPSRTICPFCDRETPMSRRGAVLAGALFTMACGGAEPAAVEPVTQTAVEESPQPEPNEIAPPQPEPAPEEPAPEATNDDPEPEPEEDPDSFDPEPVRPMPVVARYGRAPSRPVDPAVPGR